MWEITSKLKRTKAAQIRVIRTKRFEIIGIIFGL
jgi:hypothetical protein